MLTLVGGALFGLVFGTVLVSFASAIGATLAFLIANELSRLGADPILKGLMQATAFLLGVSVGRAAK